MAVPVDELRRTIRIVREKNLSSIAVNFPGKASVILGHDIEQRE
jgi:hypothetical protein